MCSNPSDGFRICKRGGGKVERRRREYRVAEGADGSRVWTPSTPGERSGEGAVPPPQKMFLTLDLKMSTSSAFWALFFCSSATYCTSKKHCFWTYTTCCCGLHAMHSTETAKGAWRKKLSGRQRGACPPAPGWMRHCVTRYIQWCVRVE